MYEDQTYEAIKQRMLDSVDDSLDKREGSIINDACSPAAAELTQAYIEIDNVLELGFADTSNGEWLEKRTREFGIDRRAAVKAVRQAIFNVSVPTGTRFFIEELYFVVTVAGTIAQVECETAGIIGNVPAGNMQAVTAVSGLTSAVLGDILIPGSNAETDASLLQRYLAKTRVPAVSGNRGHYYEWATDIPGVGDAKVYPLWNGRGTVKVVIVDTTISPASSVLVETVQNYIDPVPGQGEGMAPVGATATVESATIRNINISAKLVLKPGKLLSIVQAEFEQKVDEYFLSIAFKDDTVRYTQVGNILLGINGVIDYSDLTLNGTTGNIIMLDTEIPRQGTVVLSE